MDSASADRSLLFGVLAVQLDFVSRDDLVDATSHWVTEENQALSDVFIREGIISEQESLVLEGVVKQHLERNGDDARRTLESIKTYDDLRSTLNEIMESRSADTVKPEPVVENDTYDTVADLTVELAESKARFSILRLHQKGGLGRVSIALDEELNREIALKEILPNHADDPETRSRFVREAEITGALEHPGVVPVYSLGQYADGRPYYAMRFIRGINLQVAIESFHKLQWGSSAAQLQFRQLLGQFVDVCNAMEYAHSRGVIHRDLKPENIMLGDYGETLVVDWGLAKSMDESTGGETPVVGPVHTSERASSTATRMGRIVGTPSYMSPEQAAGRLDDLGPCSDIYSLGATLYHLLTGRAAFKGSQQDVIGSVQHGPVPEPRSINKHIPRAMQAICLKAMARLPSDRYLSARALAEDIERFLADERVMAYDEPLPAKAWRWVRNHKPLVISTLVTLTVAVAALSISVVMLSAANVLERTLRAEATTNYEEAERQRARAQHNFRLAQESVRDYFVAVSEETLLDQPGMHPLRDKLLRQALVYYQQFLKERQDDPTLRIEVAQAQYYHGKITQAIDSPANALPHYQEAVRLQEALLKENADNSELQVSYGSALNAMGDAQLRLGKLDDAMKQFQRAVEVREKRAKMSPEDSEAARTLANSLMNIGYIHFLKRDPEEGIAVTRQSQAIRSAHLVQDEENDPKLEEDLGKGYYLLGIISRTTGDMDNAEASLLSAVDVFQNLLEAAPGEMSYRRQLAVCQRLLGDLKSAEDETAEAVEYYRAAKTALEELRVRNPNVLQYASDLAGVYINLGQIVDYQGKTEEALLSIDAAINLLRELNERADAVQTYRLDLGKALRIAGSMLLDLGRPEDAKKQLEASRAILVQLVKEEPTDTRLTNQLQITNDELAALAETIQNE